MNDKALLGLLGVVVAAIQYAPYCRAIFRGKIRPHAFSYLIWSVVTGIIFAAQYADNAGPGAWATGFSCAACLLATVLSARRGVGYIKRGDWIALAVALTAIPLWVLTKNPFIAVAINTVIDMTAYIPTFRKAWHSPQEDSAQQYAVGAVKHLFSLLAVFHYDLTTTLTSAVIILSNAVTIVILLNRRAALRLKARETECPPSS